MRRFFLFLPILALFAACGSGDSVTGPDDNDDNPVVLAQGSLSAKIDGSTWNASTALTVTYNSGLLAFAGTDNTTTLAMAVGFINGPATFQIGPSTALSNALVNSTNGAQWHAQAGSGSGTVTITAITSNSVTGTFAFNAPASSGSATGTKVVTEGKFNLKF
jgi:Family of unknown function (DUF6252)